MTTLEVLEQRGISVKKSGSVFVALCPFHDDTKPSLVVFPKTDSWYCFSCCFGGDAADFVSRYDNISKKEAREKLKLPKTNNENNGYYKEILLLDIFSGVLYKNRKKWSLLDLVKLSKTFDKFINEKKYEEASKLLYSIRDEI